MRKQLSLIIGKNNTGKTSFLTAMDSFFNYYVGAFSYDDFSFQLREKVEKISPRISPDKYPEPCISMKIYISYDDMDDLSNIGALILDLDTNIYEVIISFEYVMIYEDFLKFCEDFKLHKAKFAGVKRSDFLKRNQKKYFKMRKRIHQSGNEDEYIEYSDKDLNDIINFKYISAKREVTNDKEGRPKRTLSELAAKYYASRTDDNSPQINDLKLELHKTDDKFNLAYQKVYSEVLEKIKRFSGKASTKIEVISSLEEQNLLKQNTTVTYKEKNCSLPEEYNGLGYMNLFAVLFELQIKIDEFMRKDVKSRNKTQPANINLLFIEEPEAHTHPQMQYIFIRNIKNMLKEECIAPDGTNLLNMQTIISTHSPHITCESDFEDIRYFTLSNDLDCTVEVKNFCDLDVPIKKGNTKENVKKKKNFEFVKRFLTLDKCEMFFADKVVFIEGRTEGILLSAMMKKIDNKHQNDKNYEPLLSQNISIVEVGRHANSFDDFIKFLNVKALVVTDLDPACYAKKEGNKRGGFTACSYVEGEKTTNQTIKHYLKMDNLDKLTQLKHSDRIFRLKNGSWTKDISGNLMITYQTMENNYCASSFEDSFINCNKTWLLGTAEEFSALKKIKKFEEDAIKFYEQVKNLIKDNGKTIFATDILFNSDEGFSQWNIPQYIEEGLTWLNQ